MTSGIRHYRTATILILCFAGLAIAIISGISERVYWLANFCSAFGSGCKETAEFSLLHLPLWLWGAAYYLVLMLLVWRASEFVFWWAAAAFGVELSLMGIMFSMDVTCVFCIANLFVVSMIFLISLQKKRIWQTTTVTLVFCLVSYFTLLQANESLLLASTQSEEGIVAAVKERNITSQDLEASMGSELYGLRMQMYELKKARLDQMITDTILKEEAARRGVTIESLAKEILEKQKVEVSDQEIGQFYAANRERWGAWNGSQDELRKRIYDFLVRQKSYQIVRAYTRSLIPDEDIQVFLKEPVSPMSHLSAKDCPSIGPKDAPVTVIELSDYQCPACRKTHEAVGKIRKDYEGRIRWIFMDFPLGMHKWAEKAAEAARCAEEQGKFWDYQNLLFASQEELSPDQLKQYAKDLGLQTNRFNECLDSGKYQEAVEKDVKAAKKVGVNSTPTFVINGVPATGSLSVERFKELIDSELQKVRNPMAAGRAGSNSG